MNLCDAHESSSPESFGLDGNLAQVAKWLRVLGFEAVCPAVSSGDYDYRVTTRGSWRKPGTLMVDTGNALEQVRQVLEQSGISPNPRRFFSRCLVCNVLVRSVPIEAVKGRVASGVFHSVSCFTECPSCGRVYWEGSHTMRMLKALAAAGIFRYSGRP